MRDGQRDPGAEDIFGIATSSDAKAASSSRAAGIGCFEVRPGSHRAYRYAELCELIETSGFDVSVATPWTRDAHTVTFIATRR